MSVAWVGMGYIDFYKIMLVNRHFLLVLCLIVGGTVSVLLGQDANWDLKNYHLYNPFAFLNDRLYVDLFAAGIQTYFNPLLDVPYYVMSMDVLPGYPRIVAFFMGMPYGMLIFCVYFIASSVISEFEDNKFVVRFLSGVATLLGVSGVATISQVGATFNEVPVAAIALVGLLLIVFSLKKNNYIDNWTLLLSGLLFGAAAGLKLTVALYACAAAIAIFFTAKSAGRAFAKTILFCCGWLVAFSLVWGWWGWALFEMTGNPLFPMFNVIFHSSWIPDGSGMDSRFKPKFILQGIFYPFYWIFKGPMTVAEPQFSDPRFALGFVCYLGFIFVGILGRLKKSILNQGGSQSLLQHSSIIKFLMIFIFVGYVLWEAVFSILRYAVILECLFAIVVMLLLVVLVKRKDGKINFVLLGFALVAQAGAVAYFTSYPEWGRARYAIKVFEVPRVNLLDRSLVLLFSRPVAYVAPFLFRDNPSAEFVGIGPEVSGYMDYDLGRNVAKKISSHDGAFYVVAMKNDLSELRSGLDRFQLVFDERGCKPLKSNINEDLLLCSVQKKVALMKSYGENIYVMFDSKSTSFPSSMQGWSAPESWGVWSDGDMSSMIFDLNGFSRSDLNVSFSSHAFLTGGHKKINVKVFANGKYVKTLTYEYPLDVAGKVRVVSISRALVDVGHNELRLDFQFDAPASPKALGVSDDNRNLGVGIAWMKLAPVLQ